MMGPYHVVFVTFLTATATMANTGYKLRTGVGLYAVGFVVTQQQMAAMADLACPSFTALYGKDGVLALKWHVSRHQFEVLDTVKTDTYFVAVHFYPWPAGPGRKDPPPDLAGVPQDRRDLWQDTYGRHAPGTCEEVSYLYPTSIGCASPTAFYSVRSDSLRE
jgi:hypothetical protein